MAETTNTTSTPDKLVSKDSGQVLAPTTTEQQDIITAGQRKVNLIWENTQKIIALFSVLSGIIIRCMCSQDKTHKKQNSNTGSYLIFLKKQQ